MKGGTVQSSPVWYCTRRPESGFHTTTTQGTHHKRVRTEFLTGKRGRKGGAERKERVDNNDGHASTLILSLHAGKPSCSSSFPPRLPLCQPFCPSALLPQSHANPGGARRPGWCWQAGAGSASPANWWSGYHLIGLRACDFHYLSCLEPGRPCPRLDRFGNPCESCTVAVLQILKFECQPQPLPPHPLESVACFSFSSPSTPYRPSLSHPLPHSPHFLCQSYRGLELTLEPWYVPDVNLGTSISWPFSLKP